MMRRAIATLGLLICGLGACDRSKAEGVEQGVAPPPIESSRPGVCSSGGGVPGDSASASFFARQAGGYCVDPNGATRAYGENSKGKLDTVCTELFDGECEVYKRFGLRRVVTLRYVDGKGSPGVVNVNLSKFDTSEGAYGFFTKRVVADSDPAANAPKPLKAGGAGALGSGIAYVWRGDRVAELSYTNELEAPEKLKQSARAILPEIARPLGSQLPGVEAPPAAVAALPTTDLLPLGVQLNTGNVLDLKGVGGGAIGYYKQGKKRWRTFALVRSDEAAARDVLKTFAGVDKSVTVKGVPFEAVSFVLREDEATPPISWIVARKGEKIFGVGDEEHVLTAEQSAEEMASLSLSKTEKQDLLKKLVE